MPRSINSGGGGNGHGHAGPPYPVWCGDLDAVCGPVLMDTQALFGRTLRAGEYAAASGERAQPACVVSPADDLNDALRRMVSLEANVLLVSKAAPANDGHIAVADVLGVVTKTDIARNVAAKSSLMSRDRTLGSKAAGMDRATAT